MLALCRNKNEEIGKALYSLCIFTEGIRYFRTCHLILADC